MKINMDMVFGIVRHSATVIAGIVMANSATIVNGNTTLEGVISGLMQNIASGNTSAIISTSVVILSILWSMWVKATEQTKTTIIKTLTLNKK